MTTTTRTTPTLDIVLDGPPGAEAGRFVEAEIDGRSVNAGEWEEQPARYGGTGSVWLLRIPDAEIALNDLAQLGSVELFSAEVGSLDWRRPDGSPWTITVEGCAYGWGGQSPSEAIFEAWRALATLAQ